MKNLLLLCLLGFTLFWVGCEKEEMANAGLDQLKLNQFNKPYEEMTLSELEAMVEKDKENLSSFDACCSVSMTEMNISSSTVQFIFDVTSNSEGVAWRSRILRFANSQPYSTVTTQAYSAPCLGGGSGTSFTTNLLPGECPDFLKAVVIAEFRATDDASWERCASGVGEYFYYSGENGCEGDDQPTREEPSEFL